MRKYIQLLFVGIAISLSSCRQDFVFESSNKGDLSFSKDTVYLDTVFNTIGSSTYTLKVYNKTKKDIKIPLINLALGNTSKYRMMVDGMTGEDINGDGIGDGKSFKNVELLAKDSLFIFIEITNNVAQVNPTQFLYTDQIHFGTETDYQKVELVTLIQDAYFLFPKKFDNGTTETLPIGNDEIYGFYLDENDPINGNEYEWGNDKPYVIYGYAAVPAGKTLTIHKGARIHFHADSGLIVGNGATLKIKGELSSSTETLENEVIIEGDRLEPDFSDVPGQWGTIWLTDGSTNNEIDHLTLKNATVGLLIDHNDGTATTIKNTQIYDCSQVGIYAKTAKIKGENIVINTAGVATLACTLGGDYDFKQCTFNNNWGSSKQTAVLIDNYYTDGTTNQQVPFDLTQANFSNCIIYGTNSYELTINKATDTSKAFNYTFSKCLIKFGSSTNPLYDFITDSNNILKNKNPDFKDVSKNQLMIGKDSEAKKFGNDLGISFDILGTLRDVTGGVDLGAYEHVIFP